MSVFSERLRQIMEERNITQSKLCEMTGIPKSAISQYLADRFSPKRDRTYVICRALDADPAWLMGLSDIKKAFSAAPDAAQLSEDEHRLLSFYREHPELRDTFMKLIHEADNNELAVFRAAKSKSGNIAPRCELLTSERIKRISEAPETDEEL